MFANMFWPLSRICNLQQSRIPLRNFLNLVLLCNDNGPRWGRAKNKGFFSTFMTFFYILFLIQKCFKIIINKVIRITAAHTSMNLTSSKWNLVQSEQILKHLYNNVWIMPILWMYGKKLSKWVNISLKVGLQ